MVNPLLYRALSSSDKRRKILVERLTEPLHINVMSMLVALFGGTRSKIDFDLVVRQQYAYPILRAADFAREWGYAKLSLIEFGVAAGSGLLNICDIARRVTGVIGVEFEVYGFDSGSGMPAPIDYRDLPEGYQAGDFPMDREKLRQSLPANCHLILGPIAETLPSFLASLSAKAPIGFVSVDVDYYSSARDALTVFLGAPEKYLPIVPTYFDDLGDETVNPWVGEALAIGEFNEISEFRKIAPYNMLRERRICKNAKWINHVYALHVHDHVVRTPGTAVRPQRIAANEFLGKAVPALSAAVPLQAEAHAAADKCDAAH
jgi:hypothetical protein